jgi:hypothetical protein
MNEVTSSAEAVKAVAETTGKAIDASRELGGFFSKVLGPSIEELGGMLHDHVRFSRGVRLLRLHKRYEEIKQEANIQGDVRPLGLKEAVPLLEAASLETDDELQDMFANLLVNATRSDSAIEAQRMFVSILENFGRLEAQLLIAICNAPKKTEEEKNKNGVGVLTAGLPDEYLVANEENKMKDLSPDAEIALWNLSRLGCIEPAATWGRGSTVAIVTPTALGKALKEACTVKPAK